MRQHVLQFVALAVVLAAVVLPVRGEEKLKSSPYYPLQVGTKWQYHIGDDKVNLHVARHEKNGEDLCAVIESIKDGQVIETESVAVRGDGIYRIATDDGKLDPPMLLLQVPAWTGASWKVKFKVEDVSVSGTVTIVREEVQVPAGKYQAVVTRSDDFEIDGKKVSWAVWYVRDVGIVKKVVKLGELEMALELVKFDPGQ